MNTPGQTFSRYPQHLDAIRWLPWVAKVIAGDGIDIIVLENENGSLTSTSDDVIEFLNQRRAKLWFSSLRSTLEKIGIDISQVGFMVDGGNNVMRFQEWGEDYELVWVWNIGIRTLRELWVDISLQVGDIIPANLAWLRWFHDINTHLLMNIENLRRLGIDPADVVVGARFEIETVNSVYTIRVNEEGCFMMESSIDGGDIPVWFLFVWFGKNWALRWLSGGGTSPVKSMKKL
jgi:hypothetical protein